MTAAGPDSTAPRAKTLALQGFANRIVRGLLATPLISLVIGRRLLTLYVVGRKSGKRYTVPVAYVRHEGALLVGTPFGWGRNLRTGEPVDLRLLGRRRPADVEAFSDEAHVVELYAIMARTNKPFANFNKITVTGGVPDPHDLHLAWAGGARAFRFTPR